jgi:hypothetical protein
MITLILRSYNMGNVTEAEFDAWASYVARQIDTRCGFTVDVDQARFGEAGDDVISGATDEQRETIRETIAALWEDQP